MPDLKGAILSNLLKFLQPAVGSDIWPKVFEVANSFSRKPTNMSVLHRHVCSTSPPTHSPSLNGLRVTLKITEKLFTVEANMM